jgi:hypothetical protein
LELTNKKAEITNNKERTGTTTLQKGKKQGQKLYLLHYITLFQLKTQEIRKSEMKLNL